MAEAHFSYTVQDALDDGTFVKVWTGPHDT